MIIFGTSNRFKTVQSGTFYCPHCQTTRNYELKQGKRYFSLYFVPLIPMGDLGQFVECQTCHLTFHPDILNLKQPAPKLTLADQLNAVKGRLLDGAPVEYVVRDLNSAGLDRDVALNLVNASVGSGRKFCRNCNLSYAPNIASCAECGGTLTE
jgi:transcription elongation factor Elf1